MKKIIIVIAFALIGTGSTAQITKCEAIIEMDNQLFPSYLWANANRNYISDNIIKTTDERNYFGDAEGQIGVLINYNTTNSSTVKVVLECDDIMNKTEYEVNLTGKFENYEIFPEIDYKWEALKINNQSKPITIKFSVYQNGNKKFNTLKIITLKSINECPFAFVHRNGAVHDMNFMYSAYVNELHPLIDNVILKEALESTIISNISGYQSNSDREVFAQVFAIWNVLNKQGIKYSSLNSPQISSSKNNLTTIISQPVRTFTESFNNKQANCVDGTVLFASVLYRMGITPLIVTTPSHCFLGFYLDKAQQKVVFLETTLLGANIKDDVLKNINTTTFDIYDQQISLTLNVEEKVYKTFLLAIETGISNYNADKDKFIVNTKTYDYNINADNKNAVIEALQYQLFSVELYRKQGLLSISN